MNPNTPIVPTKINPQGMDPAMTELTGALTLNLSWLDKAYSNVESFVEGKGRDITRYPATYVGTKNDRGYLKLFPDSYIGNFAYVEIAKQDMKYFPQQHTDHVVDFSIVFWFNFEQVYPDDHKNRTLENVKHEVFEVLNQSSFSNFKVRFNEFVEGAENIYKGYTHKEIENQFLMRPYGGFKVTGQMRYTKPCTLPSTTIQQLPTVSYGINWFSLPEVLTGILDHDLRPIYVSGVKVDAPFPGIFEFPVLRSEMGRIVGSSLTYESTGGGAVFFNEFLDTVTIADKITPFFSNPNVFVGSAFWFMRYTKP